jgi:hypothetical protein
MLRQIAARAFPFSPQPLQLRVGFDQARGDVLEGRHGGPGSLWTFLVPTIPARRHPAAFSSYFSWHFPMFFLGFSQVQGLESGHETAAILHHSPSHCLG